MPTTLAISANFGSGKAGLNTVGYTVLRLDRTTAQARTQVGVTESGGGIYAVAASVPDGVTQGYIRIDTGEDVPRVLEAGFNPADLLTGPIIVQSPGTVVSGYSSAPGEVPTVTLKAGDRLPHVLMHLTGPDGTAVALPDGTAVQFHMRPRKAGASPTLDAAATIIDADSGLVDFAWRAGDTDTPGLFWGEFEVTFPGGLVQTFPGDGDIPITILKPVA